MKEDIGVSSAHMVYGTSLHLPGQFFDQTTIEQQPTSDYVEQLISCMSNIRRLRVHITSGSPKYGGMKLRSRRGHQNMGIES